MKKILTILIISLLFVSCERNDSNRDLVNYIGTGVFHDTWGEIDNQSSVTWDVKPISVDHVKTEITYLRIFINQYYNEYKYSEVMTDDEFIKFIKNINNKERYSEFVQVNDSIRCTWKLFDKVYNTYIK